MDGIAYLKAKPDEARVMEAVLQDAIENVRFWQKEQAVQIANAVGKMFK